jgi:hypothetical protein
VRQRVTRAGRETRSVFSNIDPEVAQRVERAAVTGEVPGSMPGFGASIRGDEVEDKSDKCRA